jgi:uncharacterized protein YegP (UPF0339 family)
MQKIVGGAALTLVLGLFVASAGHDSAYGQTRPTRREAIKAGTVEVYKAKDGYRFRVKDLDGKTVAMPTKGYETKEECLKTLEFISATLIQAKPTEVKE